ncbi:MAG: cysteine hydrolase [Mucilaginibacter sp.]|nr:cysteine hydrolase [Mucilaginibacter sp.]
MKNIALILIDIQKGFDDLAYWGGERNNPDAETNSRKLLDYWRKQHLPIFHIQHCSSNPNSKLAAGNPGNEIKDIVAPAANEPVIKKSVNSAFIGTDLKERLDAAKIDTVVIIGLTTDHCVSTSTRMAGNYGYKTYLIADATATFSKKGINNELYNAETMHLTALAHLNGEFATILNTEAMLDLVKSETA